MPARKLTDAEVRAIRTDWATRITRQKLAIRHGCSIWTIHRILDDPDYRAETEDEKVTEDEIAYLSNLKDDDEAA